MRTIDMRKVYAVRVGNALLFVTPGTVEGGVTFTDGQDSSPRDLNYTTFISSDTPETLIVVRNDTVEAMYVDTGRTISATDRHFPVS